MTPLLHLSRTLFLFLDVVPAHTITVFSQHHVSHSCPRISRSSCPSLRSIIPDYISHMHTRHRHQLSSSPSPSSVVCCLLFSPLTPTQHTNINAYNWNFFLSFFFLFFFNRPFNYAFVSPFLSLRNDHPLSPRRPASYVLYPFENVFPNPDPFLPVFSGDLLWYLSCGDAIVRTVNRVSEPFF